MKVMEGYSSVAAHNGRGKLLLVLAALLVVFGTTAYFAAHDQIMILIGAVLALVVCYSLFKWREFATLLFVFILYTNLAVVSIRYHGVPEIVASAFILLPVLPMVNYIFQQRQRVILDQPFGLMFIYLLALMATSIFAQDLALAWSEIINFLSEGLLLYFLLINVIRKPATLRRVFWVVLLACSVLSGLSLWQELTHSYDNSYGGLALRRSDLDIEQVDFNAYSGSRSAGGPIGDENRYGQILLVALPLALYLFFAETGARSKILAAAAAALILCGIVLTFSRGTFVTLGGMAVLMMLLRFIPPKKVLLAAAGLLLVISVVLPEYYDQVDTVTNVTNLLSSDSEESRSLDGSLRGRYTQVVAALEVFLEHPITGVGPGHYSQYYSRKYGNEVGTKFLRSNRRAHNLYLEVIANLGLVGFVSFMSIVFLVLYRLWQVCRRVAGSRPDLALLATALIVMIYAYLGSAMFLHLSFQRYYWFMLALAGSALQIIAAEAPAAALAGRPGAPGTPAERLDAAIAPKRLLSGDGE